MISELWRGPWRGGRNLSFVAERIDLWRGREMKPIWSPAVELKRRRPECHKTW